MTARPEFLVKCTLFRPRFSSALQALVVSYVAGYDNNYRGTKEQKFYGATDTTGIKVSSNLLLLVVLGSGVVPVKHPNASVYPVGQKQSLSAS